MPERQSELFLLTQHYVSARYGVSTPTGDEIRQLAGDWKIIRKTRVKRPKEEQTDLQGEDEHGQDE
jgi:hypothetical protein